MTDHLGLLMMRRLPAVGATILLIALARNAVLHRQPDPRMQPLAQIATGIEWVAAADNYVELHANGRATMRRMTMARAAGLLECHGFVRIHRRYLVNRTCIAEVRNSSVRLKSGAELPHRQSVRASTSASPEPRQQPFIQLDRAPRPVTT